MGAFAVDERNLTWRGGGVGSEKDIEGNVVAGWGTAEAIGSVRLAVVGVGVGWAELRIAEGRMC